MLPPANTFLSLSSDLIMRPEFSFLDLMYAQTAFTAAGRVIDEPPQIAASSFDSVTFLKSPFPAFFCAAAILLPEAMDALLLCWPFARLPPTYLTFFAFFFFFFFFFFTTFFFFFFLAFFFGAFFAFLAFLAFGFFAAF